MSRSMKKRIAAQKGEPAPAYLGLNERMREHLNISYGMGTHELLVSAVRIELYAAAKHIESMIGARRREIADAIRELAQ